MTSLIELKEKLKNIYAEHETYLRLIFKFIAAFIALILIKSNIGFMKPINMWIVIAGAAVVCMFLSWGAVSVVLAVDIIVNVFAVSLELGVLMLTVMIIMFILFFRFTPKEGAMLIIVPLAFFLKIPYFIPIAVGLVCTPVSIVSVTFGTIIYFMLDVISKNVEMILTIVAFIVTILVVYFIKRTSVNNSWSIAIIVGGIVDLVIILVGSTVLNTNSSLIWIIVGTLISVLLAFIVQFFVFSVDYSRIEHTQFEDDEYYYYVKAVPKINVTAPEMNVKRINAQRRKIGNKK